jgi:hypothetical protein
MRKFFTIVYYVFVSIQIGISQQTIFESLGDSGGTTPIANT